VRITRPYWIGEKEVTLDQYSSVVGHYPAAFRGTQDTRIPVTRVSWEDATEFCAKLSEREHKSYRLPTEAEWEYACRAGATTPWHLGDKETDLDAYAWHAGNSGGRTHPVGSKKPNRFGLYDMYGNVPEWCWDRYRRDYYDSSAVFDP